MSEMAQWIGYLVSVKCGQNNSTYQGEIVAVTNSVITLNKAFLNGIPCSNPNEPIRIRADDIIDLKLIDRQTVSPRQSSTITVAKPLAKKAGRIHSLSESHSKSTGFPSSPHVKPTTKPIDIEFKNNSSSTPGRKEKNSNSNNKSKWATNKGWKDEECFGSPCTDEISKDFDFEKNLALFNKQAIWDELNSNNTKPDVIKQAEGRRKTKYRHDENVIASGPVVYRQIHIPKHDFYEYVTDDGLIIPCLSRNLRNKLFEVAEKSGLVWTKRVELMGRAATDISIQLLGGGHRLNPQNVHQRPTVVVLTGPNRQGAIGINAARQLSSHGVRTVVYWTPTSNSEIQSEMALYRLTKCQIVTKITELPALCDLVILALFDHNSDNKINVELSNWTNRNKAPVLALDPPPDGTPNFNPKFSILPALPLAHSRNNGKLYLCNLGIPHGVFEEIGIKYKSPFGPKFVIPLHPKDNNS